jgi:membrane protein
MTKDKGQRTKDNLLWRHAREVTRKFTEDNCPLIAAAMSFFALLSTVPLLLLVVGGLGSVLTGERAQQVVLDFARAQIPGIEKAITDELRTLIQTHEWTGGLGVLGLLWASSYFFVNLEVAMNLAWQVPTHRGTLRSRLLALVMTLLAGLPLILSLVLTVAITTVSRLTVPILGVELKNIPFVWNLAAELTPLFLSILSFTAIYRWVPNCAVHTRSAIIGGVAGGLLWELAKRVFAFYMANLAQFGRIYGPFAGLVGVMLWVFYSSMVLLLGAEIAAVAQSIHPLTRNPATNEASERLREIDPA